MAVLHWFCCNFKPIVTKNSDRSKPGCYLIFSQTRSGFPLFSPMWDISIANTRSSSRERLKTNSLTSAARWPHVFPWRHCNYKMTSPCRISAYSGFSRSLFSMSFRYEIRYLVVGKKKNPLFVWGSDRKIRPSRSPFVIIRQASWCQSVILGTDFSIPPSHSCRFL